MSTINLSHLRSLGVFATVVESGSFASAARHLHSSRSRVSEQVAQLETALGVRLLQRSTRQLVVTSEGSDVYEQAKSLTTILSNVENLITATEPQGRVAITMNHDIAHKFILPLLDEFQTRYPGISLDLILDDEKVDLISSQIDLAIRIGLPKDSALVGRVLHEESFRVFASPDYLQKNGTPRTIKELDQCRWVLLSQVSTDKTIRLQNRAGTVEISPVNFYQCNSPLMMQKMIVAGLGIGALLPGMVKAEIEENRLVNVMPSIKSKPLIFSLVYPSRQQVPQRTRVLIDFLLHHGQFGDGDKSGE